jgi:hypothetical protein
MTSVHSLPPADRTLYSRLHQILSQPGLVLGSLVTMRRTCGKEGCRCRKAPRHRHRSRYLAVRVGRKRRMLYVPPEWEPRVIEWVSRSGDVREILTEISKSFVRRLLEREA